MSDDPLENPDFAHAHRVFVPYCSSDVHSGQRTATSNDTFGYYFSGGALLPPDLHAAYE